MKQLTTLVCSLLIGLMMAGCTQQNSKNEKTMAQQEPYTKKYTNADFYKDGQFDQETAKKAFLDMFEYYGIPFTDFLKENFWVTDFGLGDFENVGMGGVFWINNPDYRYFGHEIYLLPSQMIVEHYHVASDFPAKHESWQVRSGSVYNFGIGETTPDAPKLPESQKDFITVSNWELLNVGDIRSLKELESRHFLMAGPNGAIVTEYGTYHDNNGLRFTNPDAKL